VNLLAVGLDLVEVDRVARLLDDKGELALRRLLTAAERDYCLAQPVPERHVAARLAAKEAAYKALAHGGDAGYIGWRDVEVTRTVTGGPSLILRGRAQAMADRLQVSAVKVSLTHSAKHAAAVVVLLA
jgi:holo-[acyl-carrier protein] synthase